MRRRSARRKHALALAPWLLVLGTVTAAHAQGTPPPPATGDKAGLERQLQDARSRLDDAARDVADLSRRLYGDAARVHAAHAAAGRGAMLGVNVGGTESDRAEGVEIIGVSPSGPAEAAGLKAGDVIVAVDGKALRRTPESSTSRQLVEHMRAVEPGQVVKVDYLRNGRRQDAAVTTVAAEAPIVRMIRERIGGLPEGMDLPIDQWLGGPGRGFRSLELVQVTPKLGAYFGTDKGLLVVRAPAGAGAVLEEGDVILSIGGRTPENPRHAFRILGSYQPSEKVSVEVLRQRKRMTLEMQVPAGEPAHPAPPAPPAPPARRS